MIQCPNNPNTSRPFLFRKFGHSCLPRPRSIDSAGPGLAGRGILVIIPEPVRNRFDYGPACAKSRLTGLEIGYLNSNQFDFSIYSIAL